MTDDLISRSALIKMLRFKRRAVYGSGSMDDIARVIEDVEKFPDAKVGKTQKDKPVRHGRCALCRIKETGHGIIAFYKAGWQACITKRDGGYFMVIGHEGDQVHIPVDFCPNCGAKVDGDKDAAD